MTTVIPHDLEQALLDANVAPPTFVEGTEESGRAVWLGATSATELNWWRDAGGRRRFVARLSEAQWTEKARSRETDDARAVATSVSFFASMTLPEPPIFPDQPEARA